MRRFYLLVRGTRYNNREQEVIANNLKLSFRFITANRVANDNLSSQETEKNLSYTPCEGAPNDGKWACKSSSKCYSVLTNEEVKNFNIHTRSFAYRIRQALINRLCSPTHPLPLSKIYSEICNRCRMVDELYASKTSRRVARSVEALEFLRRHNVLMHSLLFYVPSTNTWNVTSEFSRLALYGESVLRCELEARILKLFPDITPALFTEILHRLISNKLYVEIFDTFAMEQIVGARAKQAQRKQSIQMKHNDIEYSKHNNNNKVIKGNIDVNSNSKSNKQKKFEITHTYNSCEESNMAVKPIRLSDFQKCNMLCAIIGEMHWFAIRTKAIDRTHNNAIFPPSDVLILHVLCVHLLESLPAEMIMRIITPHVESIKQNWLNEPMSIPSQMRLRPRTISALSLSAIPRIRQEAKDCAKIAFDLTCESALMEKLNHIRPITKFPEIDYIKSTMQPHWNMKYIDPLLQNEKIVDDAEILEISLKLSEAKSSNDSEWDVRKTSTPQNINCSESMEIANANKPIAADANSCIAENCNDQSCNTDSDDLITREMVKAAILQCKKSSLEWSTQHNENNISSNSLQHSFTTEKNNN